MLWLLDFGFEILRLPSLPQPRGCDRLLIRGHLLEAVLVHLPHDLKVDLVRQQLSPFLPSFAFVFRFRLGLCFALGFV